MLFSLLNWPLTEEQRKGNLIILKEYILSKLVIIHPYIYKADFETVAVEEAAGQLKFALRAIR